MVCRRSTIAFSASTPVRLEVVINNEPPSCAFNCLTCSAKAIAFSVENECLFIEPPMISAVIGWGRVVNFSFHSEEAVFNFSSVMKCGEPIV